MSQNTLNANAIEYKAYRNISKIEYLFGGVSGTQTVYPNNNLIEHLYFNPSAEQQQYIGNMYFYYSDYTLSKNEKYKINLYFQTETENTDIFSSPVCPESSGANLFVMDNCEIEHIDYETFVTNINQYPDTSGNNVPYPYVYVTQNKTYNYYSMTLYGHFIGNTTNTTRIFTNGPIFFVYNTNNLLNANLTMRLYLGRIVFYNEEENASDEAAEKELEGTSNIENQTPQNTTGGSSENQQTTSIIGTISSFVGAFSNITPSQNCEMDLPFPDFVGGNQRVNICQGKDKAPAIITIASSLLLIVTFVPVAFIVLSMIYREIRSFTNG